MMTIQLFQIFRRYLILSALADASSVVWRGGVEELQRAGFDPEHMSEELDTLRGCPMEIRLIEPPDLEEEDQADELQALRARALYQLPDEEGIFDHARHDLYPGALDLTQDDLTKICTPRTTVQGLDFIRALLESAEQKGWGYRPQDGGWLVFEAFTPHGLKMLIIPQFDPKTGELILLFSGKTSLEIPWNKVGWGTILHAWKQTNA